MASTCLLPADYTFTAADQGKHNFLVTFKTAGSQSLSVTDTANSSLKAIANVCQCIVQPANNCWFSQGWDRPPALPGSPLQSVTVTVTDGFGGNVITRDTSGTVHFTSTDGQAVPAGRLSHLHSRGSGQAHLPGHLQDHGSRSVSVLPIPAANSTLPKTSANASRVTSSRLNW